MPQDVRASRTELITVERVKCAEELIRDKCGAAAVAVKRVDADRLTVEWVEHNNVVLTFRRYMLENVAY